MSVEQPRGSFWLQELYLLSHLQMCFYVIFKCILQKPATLSPALPTGRLWLRTCQPVFPGWVKTHCLAFCAGAAGHQPPSLIGIMFIVIILSSISYVKRDAKKHCMCNFSFRPHKHLRDKCYSYHLRTVVLQLKPGAETSQDCTAESSRQGSRCHDSQVCVANSKSQPSVFMDSISVASAKNLTVECKSSGKTTTTENNPWHQDWTSADFFFFVIIP